VLRNVTTDIVPKGEVRGKRKEILFAYDLENVSWMDAP
jgi:hypothetical protein